MSETTSNQTLFDFKSLETSGYSGENISSDVLKVLDAASSKVLRQKGEDFAHALADFILAHPSLERPISLLDFHFNDDLLLVEALTHTSFLNEYQWPNLKSYERLEFLGDSVLSVLVSTHLINSFDDLSEGELSRFRSSLVNGKSFAELSEFLGLGNCIIMGKGELQSFGHQKEAILCDVFESVLGAIYRDGGFEAANKSFYSLLEAYRKEKGVNFIDINRLREFDAKTRLQELTMARFKCLPEYRWQQLKDQSFMVELYVCDKKIASEKNISKKKAERNLAAKTLREQLLDQVDFDEESSC